MDAFILFILAMLIVGPVLSYLSISQRIKEGPSMMPCPPHKWDQKQITNVFGEKVWVIECLRCKKKPNEFNE